MQSAGVRCIFTRRVNASTVLQGHARRTLACVNTAAWSAFRAVIRQATSVPQHGFLILTQLCLRRWAIRAWHASIIAAAAVSASVTNRLSGKRPLPMALKRHAQSCWSGFARRARLCEAIMSWRLVALQLSLQRDKSAAAAAVLTTKGILSRAIQIWAAATELGNRRYTM